MNGENEEIRMRHYLCSSSNWEIVVESDSYENAASLALQKHLNNSLDRFSVGAVISVIPIKKLDEETHLVYSPTILADIGLHRQATELIKHIDNSSRK